MQRYGSFQDHDTHANLPARHRAIRSFVVRQTGGTALARQLVQDGVTDIFALPGIQFDWAFESLRQCENAIRVIVPRHEQATSYMADGYARSTGRVGTCMIVPGPGVLNAMAGLSTAYACNAVCSALPAI